MHAVKNATWSEEARIISLHACWQSVSCSSAATYLYRSIRALKAVDVVVVDAGLGGEDPEQDTHRESQELVLVSRCTAKDMIFKERPTHPGSYDPPVVCMVGLAYALFCHETQVDRDCRQEREDNGDDNEGLGDDRGRPRAGVPISERHVPQSELAEETGRLKSEKNIAVRVYTA